MPINEEELKDALEESGLSRLEKKGFLSMCFVRATKVTNCKLDDLTYEMLPPSITWERTGTLGRGDDCCDFRWCRKERRRDE